MGRPLDRAPATDGQRDDYLRWRFRVIEMLLIGASDGGDARETDPARRRVRESLDRARRDGARADLADRVAMIEQEAAVVLGAGVVERHVAAMLAGRSAWAAADDFSAAGPHAAPAEVVAERRARFRRRPVG